jgi:CO dehydrogenase/acetyl-CoA synthase beta subunit
MVKNSYNELNKVTIVAWVGKALDVALSKKTSKMGFKLYEFGLLIQRLWMEALSLVNSTLLIIMTHQTKTMQKTLMKQSMILKARVKIYKVDQHSHQYK